MGREWDKGVEEVRKEERNGGKSSCPPTFKELQPPMFAVSRRSAPLQ